MKQKMQQLGALLRSLGPLASKTLIIAIVGILVALPVQIDFQTASVAPSNAQGLLFIPNLPDFSITPSFGGKITKKNLRFCFFWIPFWPFVAVIPFYRIKVGQPKPADMYYLFGISKQYREYRMVEHSWALGKYFQGMDDLWRRFCTINGRFLPNVDGVIWPIGTSCRTAYTTSSGRYVPGEGVSCRKRAASVFGAFEAAQLEQFQSVIDPATLPAACSATDDASRAQCETYIEQLEPTLEQIAPPEEDF
ncbi:MAG: hypothetical protein A2722_04020 [Candidatus Doudnabacteria bacterium RIFCSPHIGHO2_01_FULL_50_11]|uniref:Uncharacterized protein n=1 Tax=Candidatus Doudnabacteria bacterium RIFCSPHIGHO2_01_FULL_50_11 TaxID=1817828 RepID=A0A1F5PNC5_9BACT|nr:MAG: hypothetical protein A2722_04020 [Candidatus Doudnabacteria bacterium RIFCSPHIGHO2_01_FULL_50_11]HLC44277.1 hypothetical protein [Patescibacteria group bacterium]